MLGAEKKYTHNQLANPAVLPITPYRPGKTISAIRDEFNVQEVLKLASNENAAGPSPLALDAVAAALTDMHLYPDGSGEELKSALAQKHSVDINKIILGHGATDLLEIIARTFLCPDDEVISAQPSFPWFQMLGQLTGARNITVPLRAFSHDLVSMAEKITPRTKLVFIANPNNPTGTFVSSAEIKSFLRDIPGNVIVVIDEAYIDYVTVEKIHDQIQLPSGRVIHVRTFSKICGLAGLRIGYGVADEGVIELLEKARQPFNTTKIAHMAALASLQDKAHLERGRQLAILGKNYLYRQFEKMQVEFIPTEANFIYVNFHRDAAQVIQRLQELGIIIRPVNSTCARITIGSQIQNERLVSALSSVLAALPRATER